MVVVVVVAVVVVVSILIGESVCLCLCACTMLFNSFFSVANLQLTGGGITHTSIHIVQCTLYIVYKYHTGLVRHKRIASTTVRFVCLSSTAHSLVVHARIVHRLRAAKGGGGGETTEDVGCCTSNQ